MKVSSKVKRRRRLKTKERRKNQKEARLKLMRQGSKRSQSLRGGAVTEEGCRFIQGDTRLSDVEQRRALDMFGSR